MEGKISQILSFRNRQFFTPRIEVEKESEHIFKCSPLASA